MMSTPLRDQLRQMVAVLQEERQALAGLDIDGILASAVTKTALCGRMDEGAPHEVDAECRGLLDAARQLNEVNRQIRNLLAANVSARLDALTGQTSLYRAQSQAYAYAGARG